MHKLALMCPEGYFADSTNADADADANADADV